MATAAAVDYMGSSSPNIEEAPLPPNMTLDSTSPAPVYDMSPVKNVRVAGELPAVNSTNFEYGGNEVGIGAAMADTMGSGISGLSSTIIRDERSFFNRQSMNDYKRDQEARRF